jgi:hypothetical protein
MQLNLSFVLLGFAAAAYSMPIDQGSTASARDVPEWLQNLETTGKTVFGSTKEIVASLKNGQTAFPPQATARSFQATRRDFDQAGDDIGTGVKLGAQAVGTAVKDSASTAAHAITDPITNAFNNVKDSAKQKIQDGVSSVTNSDAVQSVSKGISEGKDAVGAAVQSTSDSIENSAPVTAVKNVANEAKGAASGMQTGFEEAKNSNAQSTPARREDDGAPHSFTNPITQINEKLHGFKKFLNEATENN